MYIYVLKETREHCTLNITRATSDFAQKEIVSTNHKVEEIESLLLLMVELDTLANIF